jgi:hypothetical protein
MTRRWYPALVAATASFICFVAGWRGTDWAAQVYRAGEAAHHGVVLWDPGWYAGMFPLGYSLVFPVAAGYLGLWPVAIVSAAGAAFCFDRLVSADVERRPAVSWYFALSTVVPVAIGQLPTLAGEALALGCVLGLARYWERGGGHPWVASADLAGGVLLGVLAALTSPVAGVFLALALGAWGASCALEQRTWARQAVATMAAAALILVATLALPLAFPAPGYFPFEASDLVVVLAISVLLAGPWLPAPPPVRLGAALYGLASIGFFLVPTAVGDNDARFAAYIGVPLVLYYLLRAARHLGPRWRARPGPLWAVVALAGGTGVFLAFWQWDPMVEALGGPANGPSSTASFYRPLVHELTVLDHGRPTRVEVPPTAHHWESAYVAPTLLLARGWERQLDMAYNSLFYAPGPLRAGTYRSWLDSNGVSYVALADAPLDYAATGEAALLRTGTVPGLVPVWHTGHWEVWKVSGSPGLAGAQAEVTSIGPGKVTVTFPHGASSVLRVHWSPYWSLEHVPAGSACIRPAAGGWTEVRAGGAGVVRLTISVTGADHGQCSALARGHGAYHHG